MSKDDYQNKIEEHRKPINMIEEDKPNTRASRRTTTGTIKKPKQKRNLLLPILFVFFILIPVSFLIYVFAFYQPNADETTVNDNSQVQYEQNEEDVAGETSENADSEKDDDQNTENGVETEPASSQEDETEETQEEVPTEEETPAEETVVESEEETVVEEQPEQNQSSEMKTHTVQPGETLYRIAMNYYNSPDAVERIKEANGLSSDSISTGQTLNLP